MDNTKPKVNETAAKYIELISKIAREKNPLVVISCTTYNHEQYIRDALEGFVMQKTNFPFVAIVHDDASTDGTAEILRKYVEKYPDIILPIYEKENQYSKKDGSIVRIMNLAREITGAKYIALCEGDDYWTDPLKLQKQVDFLERNPDFGMCYTKTRYYYQDCNRFNKKTFGGPYTSLIDLILNPYCIPTATILVRKELVVRKSREITKTWKMGDFPLSLFIATYSKIKFLDHETAVYRILNNSACHTGDLYKDLSFIDSVYDVKEYFLSLNKINDKSFLKNNKIWDKLRKSIEHNNFKESKKYAKTLKAINLRQKI
ncbi:MAG: glycosyltransferase, partial [Muribaculaceae bacterium]|nr:glycosyltransferase [Muribaculaceae bacterium]